MKFCIHFYTLLRLFYPRRTSSEACVYPCHPFGFGCGRGVPRLPGFTLYSSDNALCSRVLPEVYRGCHQDVGAKPSLPSLSRLHQSGCVGRGPPWRRGYGWSRWIWRMALKFKGNDSWRLTSPLQIGSVILLEEGLPHKVHLSRRLWSEFFDIVTVVWNPAQS